MTGLIKLSGVIKSAAEADSISRPDNDAKIMSDPFHPEDGLK